MREFSVCPEGGTLLLTGTNGYLHLLTLKVRPLLVFFFFASFTPSIQSVWGSYVLKESVTINCVCQTKEVVRSMKINGDVCGVAFSHDGGKVFVNSGESTLKGCEITGPPRILWLTCVSACVCRGGRGVSVGHAQQSVSKQIHRRWLCKGDVHRSFTERTLPRVRVRHVLMLSRSVIGC